MTFAPHPSATWRRARFWVVTLAALALMALTASLGFWQLGRAEQKQALAATIEARMAQAPLTGAELTVLRPSADGPDVRLHRPARLRGVWVAEATVFLENRPMNGRAGFWVLTPLRLTEGQGVVLVQRGWAPRDFQDRRRLPQVPTPPGEVEVLGRLAPPPSKLYEPGPAEPGPIRQNIDMAELAHETGLALFDLSLLQTAAADDGLLRDWPRFSTEVPKHHGYAFQWFGLCALTGLLYVWFQLILPRRPRRPAQG